MRAISVQPADGSVSVQDRPVPEPAPGEVRIRVIASAVNPTDTAMARTLAPDADPFTPGMDAAGTVDALGAGVERLAVGDRVMAAVNPRTGAGGAHAELIVVPAASVVAIPAGLDPVAAATLPMNGLTALEGLALLDLSSGATVAVTGGAGVLASYVIPFAKLAGLTVIADAAPAAADQVRAFGADHVVPRGDHFAAAVREVAPEGVDAVFDTALLTRSALPAIRDGGAIAVVRGWDDGGAPERGISVAAVSVGKALERTDWLELIATRAAEGRLVPRVADIYPPERAAEAFARMDAGGVGGRLVIVF